MRIINLFLLLTILSGICRAQDTTKVDIYSLSLEELMNIKVVTASRNEQKINEAPATIMVITKDMIRNRGYQDLNDVLRDLPGVDIQRLNGWYGTVFAQRGVFGDENKRTILMVNGVVENQMWGSEVWNGPFLSMNNVDRIEVIWGPASSLYGANAFNGIINVITNSSDKKSTSVSLGGGSWKTLTASFNTHQKIADRVSVSLSGNVINSNGPIFKDIHPDYTNSFIDKAFTTAIKLQYKKTIVEASFYKAPIGLGNAQTPVYEYMYKVQKIAVPQQFRTIGAKNSFPADIYNETGTRMNFEGKTVSLKQEFSINKNITINCQGYYRTNALLPDHWDYSYKIRTRPNASNPSVKDTSYFDKINTWHYSKGGGFELRGVLTKKWAVTTIGAQIDFVDTQIDYTKKTSTTYSGILATLEESGDISRTTFRNIGTYLQTVIPVGEIFNITLGSRYDANSQYGNQITPRIGFVAFPSKQLTIKLLGGTAFRAPTAREIYSTGVGTTRISNPDLKPEKMKSMEMAVLYNVTKNVANEISLFYNQANDVIISNVPVGTQTQNQNLGKMTVYGAEYKFNTVVAKRINLFGSVSFEKGTQTILAKKTTSVYDPVITDVVNLSEYNINIPNIAEWKGNIGLDYKYNRFNFNAIVNYVGERSTNYTNPLRSVDGYTLAHLTVTSEVTKWFSLSLNIRNVFDTQNFDPGVRASDDINFNSKIEQAGRTVFVKACFNFE